jgi:hypothetical protein
MVDVNAVITAIAIVVFSAWICWVAGGAKSR